ncbi:MAG: hypothetical protein K1X85_08390 [Ignavibacteria bacterium]|nr:hypothetical protein [Ignavibacteria bacterium]
MKTSAYLLCSAVIAVFLCIVFAGQTLKAQELQGDPDSGVISGSFETDYNFVQDDDDFLMPTLVLELGSVHFELRHNYEERNSGSFWAGFKMQTGGEAVFSFTPLAGVVLGSVAGFAPGLEMELDYGNFSASTNSEYFINAENSEGNFFYTWNEFTVTAGNWISLGAVIERTKVSSEEGDVQAGVLAGLSYEGLYVTAYLFDPDKADRNVLIAIGYEF